MPERCGTEALIESMCLLAMTRLTFAPSGEKASYPGSHRRRARHTVRTYEKSALCPIQRRLTLIHFSTRPPPTPVGGKWHATQAIGVPALIGRGTSGILHREGGQRLALGCLYFEDEPQQQMSMKRLLRDEAFLIAVTIAMLPSGRVLATTIGSD